MDPLSALGLASNVVQFVNFLWKLLRGFHDIEKSGANASAENDVIEMIACHLLSHKDGLLALPSRRASSEPVSLLVSRCTAIADELLGVLDEIKLKSPRKKWKSFIAALQSVWRKEQIASLFDRLERLRAQMQFSIQLMTRLVTGFSLYCVPVPISPELGNLECEEFRQAY